jgi:DNA-binding beta-propeller fold protein YncE
MGENIMKRICLATAVALLISTCAAAAPGFGYKVTKKFPLGGEGGWDYFIYDTEGKRLFISRGTHVVVVDAATGKVTADIPDTPGVHGIALAYELGRGFISNGREGTVSIFDLKTLKVSGKVKAGDNPDCILYDPASKRVFAFNGRSKDATVINSADGTVVATLPIGGKPEFAAADGKGMVYVNNEDTAEILAIDAKKAEVTAHWKMDGCEGPSGLAMDTKNRRLFAGCDNKVMAVVNADTGKVVATPAIGEGVDACEFDPGTGYAFSSNREGTLTVIHEDSPDKYTVVENVPTQYGARTMALDPTTHTAYVVTSDFGPAPEPTKENPHPRRPSLPNSFVLLVVAK